MTGKILFNLCCFIFAFKALGSDLDRNNSKGIVDVESFLSAIKGENSEDFLLHERNWSQQLHDYMRTEIYICEDPKALALKQIDQSECIKSVRDLKIRYMKLVHLKRLKLIEDSFTLMKINIKEIFEKNVSSQKNLTPEDDLFFEF